MTTDSPFMDGYSSEEYDDVDSQEVASSVLDIELDDEYWTAVDRQALQKPEKAAEEDVNEELPEELGATFVPEIAASEEDVIQAPDIAVEEDENQKGTEELGAHLAASFTPPATLTTPTPPLNSASEETVPIEECQELYETVVVVIEDGTVMLKGDAMLRNLLRWLLLETEQFLQAFAREFMRFCRFAAAELQKSMIEAKDC